MSFDAALSRPSLAPGAFASPSRADRRSRARATPRAHADASSRVKRNIEKIQSRGSPFVLDAEDIAVGVRYASDVSEASGSRDYAALCDRWLERQGRDLREASSNVATCAEIGPNSFVARWSVEFVPAKMKWLYDLGLNWPLGELRIEKYDILDRVGETTKFTYRALFAVLRRAVVEREMRIPIAKIEGVSRLTFDDDGKLSRHEETLTLVEMVNAGKVCNKRIMRDVLEYLDTRKPPGVSLADWDIQVEDRVDIYSVPGMRQLDVDGMEDSAGNIEDATAVLGFFTLVVISFGFGFGAWYLNGLKHEALFRQMLEEGAY